MKNSNQILLLGTVLTAFAVGIGAFGAHALKDILDTNETTAIFETGSKYHFYHALGMLLIGLIAERRSNKFINLSALLILIGTLIFSFSLYVLAITNIRWLGAVTPIGGTAMIAGWISLAVGISATGKR